MIIAVVGFAACSVVGTAAPVGAEPAPPPRAVAQRVAGMEATGYSGDGHDATGARLGGRLRIDVAADGAVLIADPHNRRLRRVDAHGVIDTVPAPANERDGGEWFGRGFRAEDVVAARDGGLFLAGGEEIARLGRDGSWKVLGSGFVDAYALDADATGRVYVPDGGHQRVRLIERDGTIRTIAGGGRVAPSTKPVPARSARMYPADIELDPDGGYWVVSAPRYSTDDARLLHVDPRGMVTLVPLDRPAPHDLPIAAAPDGTLYAGYGTFVRKVADDGTTTLFGGPFTTALGGLAVAADGTVYGAGKGIVERLAVPGVREGEQASAARPSADPWADEDAGTVHRIAGDGRYRDPGARPDREPPRLPRAEHIAPGKDGEVHVLDTANSQVLRVAANGRVTVLAELGNGEPVNCVGLAAGPDGALYTFDGTGNRILRVTTDGDLSVVDGPYPSRDQVPGGLAVDRAGRFYLQPDDGHGLVRYAPGGKATPFAGTGDRDGAEADGGPARAASMYNPEPAATAKDGSVAIVEPDMHAVRVVRPDGTLVTVAGDADARYYRAGFGGDGHAATGALLNSPRGVAFGPDGTLYVADTLNNRVRHISRNGVITTIAGTGERAENGDGGPAARAALLEPEHVAVATDGAIWVSSPASTKLRRIDPDGTISTPADIAPAIPRVQTLIRGSALTVDPQGTVYVTGNDQSILAVRPGERARPFGQPDIVANTVAAAPDGSLYAGGVPLWHRYPDGTRLAVLGAGGAAGAPKDGVEAATVGMNIRDSAVGPDGTLFVAGNEVVYAVVGGRLDERWRMRSEDSGETINGIAVGPDGTVYAATDRDEVVAVRDGKAERVAGNGEDVAADGETGDGGPATEAVISGPRDVAVASDGTLYVSNSDGIRRVDTDGDIDTIVPAVERRDGSSTVWLPPTSLAVDAHGNLYFAEPDLNQVRVVVHANEMPGQGGTSLWWWLGGAALLIAAAAAFWYRRRRQTATS